MTALCTQSTWISDTEADVSCCMQLCLALYENKYTICITCWVCFFCLSLLTCLTSIRSTNILGFFSSLHLFFLKKGIPSLLGDTLAQICSCLPGGKPTQYCFYLKMFINWHPLLTPIATRVSESLHKTTITKLTHTRLCIHSQEFNMCNSWWELWEHYSMWAWSLRSEMLWEQN